MAVSYDVGALEQHSRALWEAVNAAYPDWLSQRVRDVIAASPSAVEPDEAMLEVAVRLARDMVARDLHALLSLDIDEQRHTPLQLIRAGASQVAPLLERCGVARSARDEFEERGMPEDPYGVGPLAWSDMGPAVQEAGITWGAWKAAAFLERRRAEGKIQ